MIDVYSTHRETMSSEDKLHNRLAALGLPPHKNVRGMLAALGIVTWKQFGSLNHIEWQEMSSEFLPPYRTEHFAADVADPDRLAPGHLNSLGELHKEARAEYNVNRKAWRRASRDWEALSESVIRTHDGRIIDIDEVSRHANDSPSSGDLADDEAVRRPRRSKSI